MSSYRQNFYICFYMKFSVPFNTFLRNSIWAAESAVTKIYFLASLGSYSYHIWFFHVKTNMSGDIITFHYTGLFLYPLKTLENQSFSDVFKEYKMKSVTWNELSPWVKVFLFADSKSNILALNPKMCLLLGRTFADDPLYFFTINL